MDHARRPVCGAAMLLTVVLAAAACGPTGSGGPTGSAGPTGSSIPSRPSGSPTPSLPAPTAGSLTPAASMSVARAVHSATALADGRVLIAGGCTNRGCDLGSEGGATAELFDPATSAFGPAGDLTEWRDDHAAVALPDGRVVLLGGWGSTGVLASTDIFDPVAARFTPGPTMITKRAGFSAFALDDGRVLVAGGFVDNRATVDTAEIVDLASGTTLATGRMAAPRGAYAAAPLPDGRILLAGGLSGGEVVATAEIFDPATNRFTATGSMATARYKGAAFPLASGELLVIGGAGDIDGSIRYDSTELFDPDLGRFRPGPPLRFARYKIAGAIARLANGDVLVAGGAATPELYRSDLGEFMAVEGSLGTDRQFLAAAAIDGSTVLLTGGYDAAIRPTAAAWLFMLR